MLSIGSCFAERIGQRLIDNKFQVVVNPWGNIFNPISLHRLLFKAMAQEDLEEAYFVENSEIFLHYDLHSQIFATTKEDLNEKTRQIFKNVHTFLMQADILILTWGTAWVYQAAGNKRIAANCHKQPAYLFEKRLLTVEEILADFRELYKNLKNLRPDLKIILTVSPVRHIKDTLPLNTVSKAVLRLATQHLTENLEDTYYFPSYELVLDDLRDYRFYGADMIHPNEIAEDYIWAKFGECFFASETFHLLKQWQKIKQALRHRAFQPNSESQQKFLRQLLEQLTAIQAELQVATEIAQVAAQLRSIL
jgi:hypothetical protein